MEALVTPALVLDLDIAERNIHRMAEAMAAMPASLRPHIKVHKSPQLARVGSRPARRDCHAPPCGGAGLAVAGLDDLFVVNTVTTPAKLAALAALARVRRVLLAVDDLLAARMLNDAARTAESTVGVVGTRWIPACTAPVSCPRTPHSSSPAVWRRCAASGSTG